MVFDDSNKVDDENNRPDNKTDGKTRRKSRGHYYNSIVYYTNVTGKTYYFQYFKPYSHDYRLLKRETECQCPRAEIHFSKCPWYNPDIIYILDNDNDLSTSELAAQQKIYKMYQSTPNNPPESCGCVTAA